MSESYAADRLVVQRGASFNRCIRSAKIPGADPHALALAVPFKRLPGSSALLPLGCLVGRASPSSGLMPALESCQGSPATVVVVAEAGGKGTVVSAARAACDAPGSTIQRARAWDPMVGLGGTSSSGATGTSGRAGVTLAVTMGCVFSTAVAGSVVVGHGPVWSGGHRKGDANRKQQRHCQQHDVLLHGRFPEA